MLFFFYYVGRPITYVLLYDEIQDIQLKTYSSEAIDRINGYRDRSQQTNKKYIRRSCNVNIFF